MPEPVLTGRPDLDRAALLDLVRALPRLSFLDSDPPAETKRWLEHRMSRFHLLQLPRLNDGMRLPGREGRTTAAAVLVPIVNRSDGLTLLLTQRSDTLPDHPGQISFPGGRQEHTTARPPKRRSVRAKRKSGSIDRASRSWAKSAAMRR